jgi:hypothetical protein
LLELLRLIEVIESEVQQGTGTFYWFCQNLSLASIFENSLRRSGSDQE